MVKKSPKHLKVVKVFIGSPRDLNPERRLFRDAIEKVNAIKAKNQGFLLEAVGWEDTLLAAKEDQCRPTAVRLSDYAPMETLGYRHRKIFLRIRGGIRSGQIPKNRNLLLL